MTKETISVGDNGIISGVINKSKMGENFLFKIPKADCEKFTARKYLASFIPLE